MAAGLDEFLKSAELDERAVDALRSCDPEVQEVVIARGDLNDCRNPSGAVMGRIRDAKNKKSQEGVATSVEEFITAQSLDERAAASLRGASPAVQQVVMERGDLSDCRNPSAVILSRVKDANRQGIGSWGGGGQKAKPAEVEAFLAENSLDERASEALRTCTAEVQRTVIDRGGLADTRNPSAVILGRIKDAQAKGGGKGGMGGGFGGMGGNMGMMNMMFPFGMSMMGMKGKGMGKGCGGFGGMGGCGMGGWPMMGGMGGWGGDGWEMASMMGAGGGFGGGSRGGKGGGGSLGAFINQNGIDERAAEMLRNTSPAIQKAVMGRGGLEDCRNPSAVVLARIREATKGGAARSSPY